MLHAVFVRSPLAHARIRSVDLSRAAASPGVAPCSERRRACAAPAAGAGYAAFAAAQMDGARSSTSSSIRSNRCSPTTRSATSARRSRSSWRRAAMPPRTRRNWSPSILIHCRPVVDPEAALARGRADHPRQVRHQPHRRLHDRQGRDAMPRSRARRTGCNAASIIIATPPRRWNAAASSAHHDRAHRYGDDLVGHPGRALGAPRGGRRCCGCRKRACAASRSMSAAASASRATSTRKIC